MRLGTECRRFTAKREGLPRSGKPSSGGEEEGGERGKEKEGEREGEACFHSRLVNLVATYTTGVVHFDRRY